ncbi:MAG: cation:proton antiporter [Pseudomonadota bacterium]|nr:cation:proton antiporter [Pseudomonadota bacterium]
MLGRSRGAASRRRRLPLVPLLLCALPAIAVASDGHAGLGGTLLALTIILLAAKLGADVAQRLGQPAVLGELLGGVLVGNLGLFGIEALGFIGTDPIVDALANLGVIVLLFEVGLESTVGQMAKVGVSATVVAVLGVIAPFILGYGVGAVLLPDHSMYVHLFLGATLTATSVGITARVLRDIGQSQSKEARVILGAAVIDDVLGLVALAAVSGIIASADQGLAPELGPIAVIVGKAVLFLGGSVGLGVLLAPILYRNAARLRGGGVLLGISLAFCFALSWLAGVFGLAPIVGAFAAGLILEGAHYKPFVDKGEHDLEELIHPVSHFLAPVFFVVMGFRVDLSTFAHVEVLGLALALTAAAVVGKQVCMLGVFDKSIRKLPVGIGMIPRGEVGLIFANIGLGLTVAGERIVDDGTFTAVVIMVILTTLLTPPALTWSFRRPAQGHTP